MATCFIFVKYLTDEGCQCLTLNQQGDIEASLAERSFNDILQLQNNTYTVIVAPAEHFSLHRVELPWLPEKKARAALPYALEDKLADNVENLHFAFDRNYYQQGHYLVAVCQRTYLATLFEKLAHQSIKFDVITMDWFALANSEACIVDTGLLIHDNLIFCGALSAELAPLYLKGTPLDFQLYSFIDSDDSLLNYPSQSTGEKSAVWVAKRLQKAKLLNISQGQFQQQSSYAQTKRWYYAAGIMASIWLLTALLINSIKLHTLDTQIKEVDGQIAVIYKQFFPQAQQVISPRFRIEQLMKSKKGEGNNTFWLLLNQFSLASKDIGTKLEQLRYQNQQLQVTVVSKDFNALEALQTYLQNTQINVKQTHASSKDNQVLGTLELTL